MFHVEHSVLTHLFYYSRIDSMQAGIDYIGVGTTVLIVNEQNEVLLLLRSKNTRNDQGKWSIPGGVIEFNERVLDAAIRETQEETGLHVQDLVMLGYIDHILEEEHQHWVSTIFLAKQFSGEPNIGEPEKCDDMRWFPIDAIPENSSLVVLHAVNLYTEYLQR
jgi:8-oxo-dGTP diphosphatase